jgi:hypothetical protein
VSQQASLKQQQASTLSGRCPWQAATTFVPLVVSAVYPATAELRVTCTVKSTRGGGCSPTWQACQPWCWAAGTSKVHWSRYEQSVTGRHTPNTGMLGTAACNASVANSGRDAVPTLHMHVLPAARIGC